MQRVIKRAHFDRFVFAPEDVVIAVGQDGLVANVAKYLDGQPVLGINLRATPSSTAPRMRTIRRAG